MNSALIPILIVGVFLISITGAWFMVTAQLRIKAGMSRSLKVETGPLLRQSPWGSGEVNGVIAKGCLRVTEYQSGWMVQFAAVFGGGELWLPRSHSRIGEFKKRTAFRPSYRNIICGKHHLRLKGKLATFFGESGSA